MVLMQYEFGIQLPMFLLSTHRVSGLADFYT